MKKVLSILLTAVLLLGLVGCNSTDENGLATAKNSTLTHFIDALKDADKEKADKYGDYDYVVRQLDIGGLSMTDDQKNELVKATFSKLKVEIRSVEDKDKNTKLVHATVTTKDMVTALEEGITNMYQYASQNFTQSGTGKLQKTNYSIFLEAINNKQLQTVSNDTAFTIAKENGKWKVKLDNASLDNIYGGYVNQKVDTITNAYNESMESSNAIDQSQENADTNGQSSSSSPLGQNGTGTQTYDEK